jgi:chlorite dismutase
MGQWHVEHIESIAGPPLPKVSRIAVREERVVPQLLEGSWLLTGVTSYERYVRKKEHRALALRQSSLGRPEATEATLIPVRKSDNWWELSQDERREIFEERSHHISLGMDYLPAIARRLLHCRELGQPFDFLTWFEYSPTDTPGFKELLEKLRQTEEWSYVDREVEIQLKRD